MSKRLFPLILLLLAVLITSGYSQNDDLLIGKLKSQIGPAVFDLSDPMSVNIEVNLWGFVKYPGRYKIPYNSTILDLLSFSGGPTENSNLEEIRIYRPGNDSQKTKSRIIKLNYDNLMWGKDINKNKIKDPVLESGDIVVVMEERRYTLRDNLLIALPIISSLLTITTLVVTLTK
jgi:SLBB domain